LSAAKAAGEFLLFIYPGIFPERGAIDVLLERLDLDSTLAGAAGRWSNAAGKLEVGYNVRRFPAFAALILDILLLNKLFPRNRSTRRYKMHDFAHDQPIHAEHVNDCVFMVRREAVRLYDGFNEEYAPGWFDQVEFCQALQRAGGKILYEPRAVFVSNEKVPLVDRLVRDRYVEYRRAERLYIRNHFGWLAEVTARVCIVVGMVERVLFSMTLPPLVRKWCLWKLRSYVDDDYIRALRRQYWIVLKRMMW
jgi:GT2 family glycosyltransferase